MLLCEVLHNATQQWCYSIMKEAQETKSINWKCGFSFLNSASRKRHMKISWCGCRMQIIPPRKHSAAQRAARRRPLPQRACHRQPPAALRGGAGSSTGRSFTSGVSNPHHQRICDELQGPVTPHPLCLHLSAARNRKKSTTKPVEMETLSLVPASGGRARAAWWSRGVCFLALMQRRP